MIISEKTTIRGHFLGNENDLIRPFILKGSGKTDWARRLATIYLKYDRKFNIRADIAFAQGPCHETGMLEFTGIAKPEWNNFCGLGITGPGAVQTFKTEELGVLAHFVHLAWYIFPDHVNSLCSRTYDPRHFEEPGKHHPKYTGDLSIGFLGGKWAVPGITYAQKIAFYANIINNTLDNSLEDVDTPFNSPLDGGGDDGPSINMCTDKFDIIVQMGHVGIYKGMTGTPGEREWNKNLGLAMNHLLAKTDLNYKIVDGLVALPVVSKKCKVFMSLHCDGATDPKAHGYTLGFKPDTNEAFKNVLSDSWGKFSGFTKRKENSTGGLRLYYYWTSKKEYPKSKFDVPPVIADYYALLEHFFMTNPQEKAWGLANIDRIAKHHVDVIVKFLGGLSVKR